MLSPYNAGDSENIRKTKDRDASSARPRTERRSETSDTQEPSEQIGNPESATKHTGEQSGPATNPKRAS